jgi:hypothetical protein
LFDAKFVREEKRREFNLWLKSHGSFFKHANRDPDAIIDFHPALTELFILVSIKGISLCGESLDDESLAFMLWVQIHKPHFISDEGGENRLIDQIPSHALPDIKSIAKHDFLQMYKTAKAGWN